LSRTGILNFSDRIGLGGAGLKNSPKIPFFVQPILLVNISFRMKRVSANIWSYDSLNNIVNNQYFMGNISNKIF